MIWSTNRFRAILLSVALLVATSLRGAPEPASKEKSAPAPSPALEHLAWRDPANGPHEIAGRILVEASDGGLLLLGQDGRLWTIDKPALVSRKATSEPFRPLSAAALGRQLQAELGPRCEVVVTRHYVICSRASRQYAQWCGNLFERLYTSFHNHWKQRGMKLAEPEFPLVALVFPNATEFAEFATKDAGADAATAKGYFSIGTNRMVLYDLTATVDARADTRVDMPDDISSRLASVPYNIATVVHEATHQIAFNSGMHTRYADNPLWLVEGMAMYFETPDLRNKTGWRTAGAVNDERLGQFRDFLAKRRKPDSLATLICTDARFTDAEQMPDAYSEAWALSYFLIRTKKEAYVKYLTGVSAKPLLVWDKPAERLAEFRTAFGDDLDQLNADLLKYLRKLK